MLFIRTLLTALAASAALSAPVAAQQLTFMTGPQGGVGCRSAAR